MNQIDLFTDSVRPPAIFFNTNHMQGAELVKAKRQAASQEETVLAFFKGRPGQLLTPEDALRALPPKTPITSARRAITTLCAAGLLRKTERMRAGQYGKPIHFWTAA